MFIYALNTEIIRLFFFFFFHFLKASFVPLQTNTVPVENAGSR